MKVWTALNIFTFSSSDKDLLPKIIKCTCTSPFFIHIVYNFFSVVKNIFFQYSYILCNDININSCQKCVCLNIMVNKNITPPPPPTNLPKNSTHIYIYKFTFHLYLYKRWIYQTNNNPSWYNSKSMLLSFTELLRKYDQLYQYTPFLFPILI